MDLRHKRQQNLAIFYVKYDHKIVDTYFLILASNFRQFWLRIKQINEDKNDNKRKWLNARTQKKMLCRHLNYDMLYCHISEWISDNRHKEIIGCYRLGNLDLAFDIRI